MGAPSIVLIGAPGSGKTSVGTGLASRLGVGFRDTDADVEATTGKSVAEIFVEDGEPRFRELERAAVRTAISEHDGVLALGGGAVMDADTRRDLAELRTCWLQVGLAQASSRVGLGVSRPLLLGNVRGTLMRLLDERAPLYAEAATMTIDTDDMTVEQVIEEIARQIQEQS